MPLGNYVEDTSLIFSGNFDGADHEISNLYINRPTTYNQGMFGNGEGGKISKIGLISIDIKAYNNIGGLVGIYGMIENSYVTGIISGNGYIGGLVGYSGNIINSYVNIEVIGSSMVGGLVGHTGIISNSYAIGSVIGSDYTGGLFGAVGNISNSYSAVVISGNIGSSIGSLSGHQSTQTITKSYGLNNPTLNAIGNTATNNSTDACSVGKLGCLLNSDAIAMQSTGSWSSDIWNNLGTTTPILKNVGGVQ